MTTFTSQTFREGEGDIVLLPDEISFGPDVNVVLTRVGEVIEMRRLRPDLDADGGDGR